MGSHFVQATSARAYAVAVEPGADEDIYPFK